MGRYKNWAAKVNELGAKNRPHDESKIVPWLGAVRFDLTNLIRLIAKNRGRKCAIKRWYAGKKGLGLALGAFFSYYYCELNYYLGLFDEFNRNLQI